MRLGPRPSQRFCPRCFLGPWRIVLCPLFEFCVGFVSVPEFFRFLRLMRWGRAPVDGLFG